MNRTCCATADVSLAVKSPVQGLGASTRPSGAPDTLFTALSHAPAGSTSRANDVVAVHPNIVTVYTTVSLPDDTPVTTPVAEPIVDIPGLFVLQIPPDVALVSATEFPGHTLSAPVIVPVAGNGFTVTVMSVDTLPHAVDIVYVIEDVPGTPPVKLPVAPPTWRYSRITATPTARCRAGGI